MKVSELKNRPIVSLSGGTTVGEVADLTIDATSTQVGAFLLAGRDNSIVPFLAVRHIGPDAVTIDDSRIVQASGDHGGAERRIDRLIGLPVLSEAGAVIGSLDDLEFDPDTGRITSLLIHHGGVIGIGASHETIPASAIRGIGPEMVTVDREPVAGATRTA